MKPDADKNFAEEFKKDMKNQLNIGNYYLKSVTQIAKGRDNYMTMRGYESDLKSVYSITAFLFINVLLIVVAIFWFRLQSRQSEIGLRMALGASRANIKYMFIIETILLLFIASIIATTVNINITLTDILNDIGVPTINRENEPMPISQYLINYGLTFALLAIISILAVWYPAHRASKTQVAMVLKQED